MSSFAVTSSPSLLVNVPDFVQQAILSYLSASDLAQVASVSRGLNEAARSTAALIVGWLQRQHFPSSGAQIPLGSSADKAVSSPEIAMLREMTRDRIICVGGAYSEYSVAQLCVRSGAWSAGEETITARDGSELVSYGGCLYSIGGEGDNALRTVDRFDLFRSQWTKCSPMLRPLRQSAAVVVQDRLVVLGGEDAETNVTCSSVSSVTFKSLNQPSTASSFSPAQIVMNFARKGHSAVVYDNKIWVAGGALADGCITESVETIELDAFTNTRSNAKFEVIAPMTYPRKNFKLVVIRDQLYAVGGDTTGTIETYDEFTGTWMLECALPCYRRNFSVCTYNNKICVFGGQDKRCNGLNTVDVYDVAESEWGVDCGKVVSAPVPAPAGAGNRPRAGSFHRCNSKKSQSDKVSIRKYDEMKNRNSKMVLTDFNSGFVCGQSVALSFAQLTWSC
jgi:hypothetical protein